MRTITNNQFLQLIGLMTLAVHHDKAMKDITDAALAITKETNRDGYLEGLGHTYDAVWTTGDPMDRVREMMRRLDIRVETTQPDAAPDVPDAPEDLPDRMVM